MKDTPTVAELLQRHQKVIEQSQGEHAIERPCIVDNDKDEITVFLGRRQLRSWSYGQDTARRVKMLAAREYVEGWCACRNEMLMNP